MRALPLLFLLMGCSSVGTVEKIYQIAELSYFEGCIDHSGKAPVVQLMCQKRAHEWRTRLESK